MTQALLAKLMSVLESSLSKLSRYDEGSLIGSLLSFTNVSGSGRELGQAYVNFIRNCMDQIRTKVNDDLWIINFFEVRRLKLFRSLYGIRTLASIPGNFL